MTKTPTWEESALTEFRERLSSSRKYNWTGGFEQEFIEEWFNSTIHRIEQEAREDERKSVVRELKTRITKYSNAEERLGSAPWNERDAIDYTVARHECQSLLSFLEAHTGSKSEGV